MLCTFTDLLVSPEEEMRPLIFTQVFLYYFLVLAIVAFQVLPPFQASQ